MRQAMCESSPEIRIQLKAVTKTAMTHEPMPHASPTTTTIMALTVSFGLSSAVRKRSRAPIPKMTNASVWLVPLNSATIAPTMPRRTSVLRSSRSDGESRLDERRGSQASIHAQPHANVKLRKSRSMNSGFRNCARLFRMDCHESPCGSVPPPTAIDCLVISSVGFSQCRRWQHADKQDDGNRKRAPKHVRHGGLREKDATT